MCRPNNAHFVYILMLLPLSIVKYYIHLLFLLSDDAYLIRFDSLHRDRWSIDGSKSFSDWNPKASNTDKNNILRHKDLGYRSNHILFISPRFHGLTLENRIISLLTLTHLDDVKIDSSSECEDGSQTGTEDSIGYTIPCKADISGDELDQESHYYNLIDSCKIKVIGGTGGDGCLSFRREKHVPLGGANGGNGGPGGDVYLQCDETLNSLSHVRAFFVYRAKDGKNGLGSQCNGAKGKDLYVYVPSGTVILGEGDETYAVLMNQGDKIRIARGGRGGKGNRYFMSKFNTAPKICERGEEGISRIVTLIYKIPGNIALIGKPNSGKSSILRCLSNAKPKVANYPFSTTRPIHGVMNFDENEELDDTPTDNSDSLLEEEEEEGEEEENEDNLDEIDFDDYHSKDIVRDDKLVLVDIPGLIEGANEGRGLGHSFLKHVERCNVISYVLDSSAEDPIADYLSVRREVELYDETLLSKMELVLLNKVDLVPVATRDAIIESLRKLCKHDRIYYLSARTLENIDDIKQIFAKIHQSHLDDPTRDINRTRQSVCIKDLDNFRTLDPRKFEINKIADNEYRIVSEYLERKVSMMRFELPETLDKLRRMLKNNGIRGKMDKFGIQKGDIVHIGSMSFSVGDE